MDILFNDHQVLHARPETITIDTQMKIIFLQRMMVELYTQREKWPGIQLTVEEELGKNLNHEIDPIGNRICCMRGNEC